MSAVVYIDGFNHCYGLRSLGWPRCSWLDAGRFGAEPASVGPVRAATKCFTARIRGVWPGAAACLAPRYLARQRRQATYLEARAASGTCSMFLGHYLHNRVTCRNCGATCDVPGEKVTDVTIATECLTDAFAGSFSRAIVRSADGDLTPPIRAVRRLSPGREAFVAFPPGTNSRQLGAAAHRVRHVNVAMLRRSQLPGVVRKADGFELHRPPPWS